MDGPRRFLRPKETARLTGYSQTQIWRLEREDKFPKRYRLGDNAVGHDEAEVMEWLRTRARGCGRVVPRKRASQISSDDSGKPASPEAA